MAGLGDLPPYHFDPVDPHAAADNEKAHPQDGAGDPLHALAAQGLPGNVNPFAAALYAAAGSHVPPVRRRASARNAAAAADIESVAAKLAKAKSVLNQPFVLMSLVYSLVIGFSLASRGDYMSLVNGKPMDAVAHAFTPGPDKWATSGSLGLAITGISFLVVTLAHFYLISHLVMRPPAGVPTMDRFFYAWVAPTTLTLATLCYYLHYLSLARYGVDNKEWIIFGAFTAFLCFGSAIIILCPVMSQKNIVVVQAGRSRESAV